MFMQTFQNPNISKLQNSSGLGDLGYEIFNQCVKLLKILLESQKVKRPTARPSPDRNSEYLWFSCGFLYLQTPAKLGLIA